MIPPHVLASLGDDEVAELTEARPAMVEKFIEARKIDLRVRPLAFARLWDRPAPRTSQRRAIQALLRKGARNGFLLGGNRSGKSASAAQLGAAFMLGQQHPDVQRWARINALDVSAIPEGPGKIYAVALSSPDSVQYQRPEWARWLGERAAWTNREGRGDATAKLDGGRVVFKADDQGREGMQGTAVRGVFGDEELSLPVFDELQMRLVDQSGIFVGSMTPLKGWTPLLKRHVREPAASTVVVYIWGDDNPHVPAHELNERLAKFGAHEQAARRRGEIGALEGRVYAAWSRALHVREVTVDPTWPRFVAVDWGTTNPTAMLGAAYDTDTDTVIVLDEVYRPQMTVDDRAEELRRLEARIGGKVKGRAGDPADGTSMASLRAKGIAIEDADKEVRGGINAVASRLQPDPLGEVHLVVHPRCANTADEADGYVWDNEDTERPRKVNDHAMDALRYLVMMIDAYARNKQSASERVRRLAGMLPRP